MESNVIVAIVGVVGGVIGSAITAFFNRRKSAAETEHTEADANEQVRVTVMMLLEPLKTRITELECEIAVLRAENVDLKAWSEALVRQVISLGAQPVTIPQRPAAKEQKTQPRRPTRKEDGA